MFVIVGWLIAMVCIFGVYIFHGGNISVILHALPFEMITIFGAAFGAFLANNQMKVVKASMKGLGQCFKGGKYSKRTSRTRTARRCSRNIPWWAMTTM